MTIHQISIFIENKFGRLADIFEMLAEANIRVIATTVADTSEYGILRLIVSEPQKAYNILRNADISANMTEVFAIEVNDTTSSISTVIRSITQLGISVEYIYCFINKGQSMLILRTNNESATREAIRRNNINLITENDLLTM